MRDPAVAPPITKQRFPLAGVAPCADLAAKASLVMDLPRSSSVTVPRAVGDQRPQRAGFLGLAVFGTPRPILVRFASPRARTG